jgi:NitT/TauT family transport system substrate-binding protein
MTAFSDLVATTILGVAMGAAGLATAAQGQEMMEINIITPNDASCAVYPQFTADAFGFWASSGIKVNLLSSETTVPYVAFLQNGDADLVMLDSAQVLQAADSGLPIRVVYEAFNFAPEGIVVPADSPIQEIADLKGATVGLASDRDLITVAIALDSIGTTPDDYDIAAVVVGDSGPVMAGALRDGTIAAFAGAGGDRAAIRAAGLEIRNITPPEVSRNPGNSWTGWGPTLEEKREKIAAFLRGWAMAQHAGVVDTKLTASACRARVPEQFENLETGMDLMNFTIYEMQLRRTKDYGELQPDVWSAIQGPYLKQKQITKTIVPSTFLDTSFIQAANAWTLDGVKRGMNDWKAANRDKLLP